MDTQIKLSARSKHMLEQLLLEYVETVENSLMTDKSRETYISQATMFVNWCKGEFEPGETLL